LRPSEIAELRTEYFWQLDEHKNIVPAEIICLHGNPIYIPPKLGDKILMFIVKHCDSLYGWLFTKHNSQKPISRFGLLAMSKREGETFRELRKQAIRNFAQIASRRDVQIFARLKDRKYVNKIVREVREG